MQSLLVRGQQPRVTGRARRRNLPSCVERLLFRRLEAVRHGHADSKRRWQHMGAAATDLPTTCPAEAGGCLAAEQEFPAMVRTEPRLRGRGARKRRQHRTNRLEEEMPRTAKERSAWRKSNWKEVELRHARCILLKYGDYRSRTKPGGLQSRPWFPCGQGRVLRGWPQPSRGRLAKGGWPPPKLQI